MKNIMNFSLLMALVIASINFSFAQNVGVRAEVEYSMKNLKKYKKELKNYDPTAFNKFTLEYNKIVVGINAHYMHAAKKISNGYTLVKGERVLRAGKVLQEKITVYERRAIKLMQEVDQTLAAAVEESFSPSANKVTALKNALKFLAPWILKLEKKFKDKACKQAKEFYQHAHWKSYEVLVGDEKPTEIDYSALGLRCEDVQ